MLFTSPMIGGDVNVLQFLDSRIKSREYSDLLVSLFYKPDTDHHTVAKAFELGLLSCHKQSYVRDFIITELESLFTLYNLHGGDDLKISAEYLRQFLKEHKHYLSLKVFEENFIRFYPGDTKSLVRLAEALYLNNEANDARQILMQVKLISSNLESICNAMVKRYEADCKDLSQSTDGNGKQPNFLNVNHLVVIDPDTDVTSYLEALLHKLGVTSVKIFADGLEAWSYIEASDTPKIELLICEWKIPSLATPLVIQRMRDNNKYYSIPVMVISSLIREEEYELVQEIGVDFILNKPFEHEDFLKALVWFLGQNRKPTNQAFFENKILRLLKQKRGNEASRLLEQFIEDDRFPNWAKDYLSAELSYYKKDFKGALGFCIKALKEGKNSAKILNLLGSTYLHTGNSKTALKVFEKANKIAPKNIKRLLSIAEVSFDSGQAEKSKNSIKECIELDPTNQSIVEKGSTIALKSGDVELTKELFNQSVDLNKIIGNMNNMAVAFAKSSRFNESLQLYHTASKSLPDGSDELKYTIIYNLSLAHIRAGELNESRREIEPVLTKPSCRVFLKGQAIAKKLDHAIAKNISLKLASSENGSKDEENSTNEEIAFNETGGAKQDVMEVFSVDAGSRCCYRVYFAIERESLEAEKFIQA